MSWKLRKYPKVVQRKTKDTDRKVIKVREHPIRETTWKHDRLKVPKLGEVKIYMHRPLQGDPKEVSLLKKRVAGMLISLVNSPIRRKLNRLMRLLLMWGRRTISQLPMVKKRTIPAGIVKQKV